MFSTEKFCENLIELRKNANMSFLELADKLNVTKQVIEKYERDESFPDISSFIIIADIYNITLIDLINSGEPTKSEFHILWNIAIGNKNILVDDFSDIVNLAPILKPSILTRLCTGLSNRKIDILNIIMLAQYLSEETIINLLKSSTPEIISDELLDNLILFHKDKSKKMILN